MNKPSELERLRAELDDVCLVLEKTRLTALDATNRVRKEAAAMREALKTAERAIQEVAGINDETRLGLALKDVNAILTSTTVSQGYVSKDKLKPLAALAEAVGSSIRDALGKRATHALLAPETFELVNRARALEVVRDLGIG